MSELEYLNLLNIVTGKFSRIIVINKVMWRFVLLLAIVLMVFTLAEIQKGRMYGLLLFTSSFLFIIAFFWWKYVCIIEAKETKLRDKVSAAFKKGNSIEEVLSMDELAYVLELREKPVVPIRGESRGWA